MKTRTSECWREALKSPFHGFQDTRETPRVPDVVGNRVFRLVARSARTRTLRLDARVPCAPRRFSYYRLRRPDVSAIMTVHHPSLVVRIREFREKPRSRASLRGRASLRRVHDTRVIIVITRSSKRTRLMPDADRGTNFVRKINYRHRRPRLNRLRAPPINIRLRSDFAFRFVFFSKLP